MTDKNYTQLCVWPGMNLGECTEQEFVDIILEMFGARVKYHTTVKTLPDIENGRAVPGTGGRTDMFFYVHSEDIPKFAIARLQAGIRWWEDVVGYNDNSHLYTEEFINEHNLTW